jgi:hypothetical protein
MVKLASRKAQTWREGSNIWGDLADGPYTIDPRDGLWELFWYEGQQCHRLEPFRDEAVARAELKRLAGLWREQTTRRVYFIGTEPKIGELVKIGVAFNPQARLATLQTAWPVDLRILAAAPGDRPLEDRYHRRFRKAHVRGEWFTITRAIKSEIDRITQESNA